MTQHQAAHHMKIDAISEREERLAELLAEWRLRRALQFPAQDPLTFDERGHCACYPYGARLTARAWLGDTRARRRERLRRNLRVVTGGRR